MTTTSRHDNSLIPRQKWLMMAMNSSFFMIRNKGSNKLLEQDGRSIIAVSNILCDDNQVWELIYLPLDDNLYIGCAIKNKKSGMVLDNFAGKAITAHDDDIHNPHHQWMVIQIKGRPDLVHFMNIATQNVLDHYRGWDDQSNHGDTVQAWTKGEDLQLACEFHQWIVEPIPNEQLPPPKVCIITR